MNASAILSRILSIAVLCVACSTVAFPEESRPGAGSGPVVHQLRSYEVFEHNKRAFHDRFRDHAMRIMAKYDFDMAWALA
ncbi:MAG: hypothetical protein ACREVI_03830 [Steroidobacteraceae bacterium]